MNDAMGWPQSVLALGGGSDIGRAILSELAQRRTNRVVLAGNRPESLHAVARQLGACETVSTAAFDASQPVPAAAQVAGIFDDHGPFDLALVATGVLGDQQTDERQPDQAARVITINFTGLAAPLVTVANRMREQGYGTIVVLSSVAAERVRPANFVYGSAKAGLDGFCMGLSATLRGSGVRMMVVRPGYVRTKMTAGRRPAPFATTAEEVARQVIIGLERRSEVVWAPPALRGVMMVLRHLPRPIFRRLPA